VLLGGAELASPCLAEAVGGTSSSSPLLPGSCWVAPHGAGVPLGGGRSPAKNWDLLEQRPLGEGELLLRLPPGGFRGGGGGGGGHQDR